MKTTAAERFIDAITQSWDSRTPYALTAERGLSDVDADALRAICDETGDDYDAAEVEVMEYIRGKVS